ncbi:DEAD/DEAH box helicase [Aureibacter tunicatorum]|uniref:ATP-dependent RNA helicase RhlE n=1 Tax=Aureibacter tunicatorum TaxID=866807 RepID=A0AAE4BS15_9BACT|nr:DEAD/DEAH box helicase [Aureibacter tunicatorum]MDR6238423.1 ATP-dependent RNA helicase RhlE [Aureibacter tunicatorum]BDD03455.1 DEAD/DEAH box helicase [Aureibacter tunicatorum]
MKFENYYIAPEIKKTLALKGFRRPTDIQFKSIPPILKGEDVLAIAQTGTGKTAAFAIPILHKLHENKTRQRREDGIKCVVMVPTRELALQITEVFKELGAYTNLNILCVHGGVEQDSQIKRLEKGVDIMIATPGRMFDLVSQKVIRLNRVDILVLDEADHMLDLGFIKDIRDLIKFLPKKRQTLFFSATIDQKIKDLAYSLVFKPVRIQISPKDPVSKNVNHSVMFVEMDDKRFFLERLVKENPESKILVFVRTKVRAERVSKAMERVGIKSMTMHGGKEQSDRLDVLGQFKVGKVKLLIATDVSARGIDIPNVDYVVNYDLPDKDENYVHRVGRTGRGKEKGNAVSFCSSEEKEMLDQIEVYLGKKIQVLDVEKQDYQETLDFTEDHTNDWKGVMKEIQSLEGFSKKKKNKKK